MQAVAERPRPLIAHAWRFLHQPAATYAELFKACPSAMTVFFTYLLPIVIVNGVIDYFKATLSIPGTITILVGMLIVSAIVAVAWLHGHEHAFARAFTITAYATTPIWLADMLMVSTTQPTLQLWNGLLFLLSFGYFCFLMVTGTRIARTAIALSATHATGEHAASHPIAPKSSFFGALGGGVDRVANLECREVAHIMGIKHTDALHTGDEWAAIREKHTEQDTEEIFTVGTRQGTPDLAHINAVWPRPWVFFRVLSMLVVAAIACVIGAVVFRNSNFIPAVIFLGAFAVPLAVLIFDFEANVPRNVSIYQVIKMVLIGGTLALIVSIIEYALAGNAKPPPVLIGIIEETGKVAALLLLVGDRRYFWTLNGLLIGGAIGVGFAGFETAGYALSALASNNAGAFFVTLIERAILAPGAHAAWAAMNGAALWRVKGNRPFSIAMLFDWRFLRVFVLTIVLHALWDTPAVANIPFALGELLLTSIAVVAVLAFVQDGINQVRDAQAAAGTGAVAVTAPVGVTT